RVLVLVKFESLTEYFGTGGEVSLPERIADDGDRWRSCTSGSFRGSEDSAHQGRCTEKLKPVSGHFQYFDRLRYLAIGCNHAGIVLREALPDRRSLAQFVYFSEGQRNIPTLALPVLDCDESNPIGVPIRVRIN